MTDVVIGLAFDLSWTHRQHQGEPVQHLELEGLIDANHHRVLGSRYSPPRRGSWPPALGSVRDLKPLAAAEHHPDTRCPDKYSDIHSAPRADWFATRCSASRTHQHLCPGR